MSIFNNHKFPWSNLHNLNLDWLIEQVKNLVTKTDTTNTDVEKVASDLSEFEQEVANTYETKENVDTVKNDLANFEQEVSTTYEPKDNLTNVRKLSENGDFTGTLCNGAKTACEVVTEIDGNKDQIQFLTNQFEGGATGQVIDGGFFGDTVINNSYDGGSF